MAAPLAWARKASIRSCSALRHIQVVRWSPRRLRSSPACSPVCLNFNASLATFATPVPSTDEQSIAEPSHQGRWARPPPRAVCKAERYSTRARLAGMRRSPSALFTTTRSAASTMPRLMPCSSSPPAGGRSSRHMSATSVTSTSDWPTPTVSTSTMLYPAASMSITTSSVCWARPPRTQPDAQGLTYALGFMESLSMRVLSPRMEPPERCEEGSTATTATL
mmetsp:Transcript_86338/g.230579  ORF Transcript_86338/g.230579 Transcript_86338/m.230579 type:complete len:221 (-) Transcript_86338:422-1084(-)